MDKKLIGHVKFTNCAWAPDMLVKCINKYSEKYKAILIHPPEAKSLGTIPQRLEMNFDGCDIIHFHNKFLETTKNKLIQYHSPPHPTYVNLSFSDKKLVVAQYQATLKEYRDCSLIRNIIDLDDTIYKERYTQNKIRIGFSPSVKLPRGNRLYESKGHIETEEILLNITKKYKDVEVDIIYNVDIKECLERKSKCNIIIDECATNSYHRSGLEGLALGKVTICSLSSEIKEIIKKVTNSDEIPFEVVWLNDLEGKLNRLIAKGISYINDMGERSWKWMRTYWSPISIVKELEDIYQNLYKGEKI